MWGGERMLSWTRITCLWPGLTRLWWRGEMTALAVAIGFACLLNGLLLASFWRPVWISAAWTWAGWLICLALWCTGVWAGGRPGGQAVAGRRTGSQQDLLNRAQTEYLRGSWSDAQALLELQIRRNPGDLESHLLLSSVFRRSGRFELSRRTLAHASRLEGAERWLLEMQREREVLDRQQAAQQNAAGAGAQSAQS
jgi:hypothetical protein